MCVWACETGRERKKDNEGRKAGVYVCEREKEGERERVKMNVCV